jgi:hypothetical protein
MTVREAEDVREMRMTRRRFLAATAAGAAVFWLPRRALADETAPRGALQAALAASPLVYVSPLGKDGSESTCHGEVWFVAEGGDVLVVTAAERWKAKAIAAGRDRARLWVGDFGVWTRADGKWRSAPRFDATAAFEKDAAARERALQAFGKKYPGEWSKWGPRFRDGLADGTRVLIRYRGEGAQLTS